MNHSAYLKRNSLKKLIGGLFLCLAFGILFQISPLQAQAQISNPYVTFTSQSVSKGSYSTPIWEQHTIWAKKSSSARHGCGVCVTAMALNLNGVICTPNDVLAMTNRSMTKCPALKPSQAVACLNSNGVPATAIFTKAYSRANCVNIMKNALNNGQTVMAVVKGNPFSSGIHWVYLTGYASNHKVVVANSSYGTKHICRKTGSQVQLASWSTIMKRIVRGKNKWSYFVIVG